jgi:DNA-binding transcriptional LysR family regulator
VVEEMSVVLMDALERDEIDIAFAYDVHERPGLLRVPLLEEELLFVTSAGEPASDEPIEFADVIRRPLVLRASATSSGARWMRQRAGSRSRSTCRWTCRRLPRSGASSPRATPRR